MPFPLISADSHVRIPIDDLRKKLGADVHTEETAMIGTAEHVAEVLASSLETIVAGLPEESA